MKQKTEKMNLAEQGVIRKEALLAYVNNTLSAEERSEIEALLKDDLFAQEALEGLQKSNNEKAVAAIASINKKIIERSGLARKKTIQLRWATYAVAAAVLGLLVGIGFLMVNFFGANNTSIVLNQKEEQEQIKPAEQPPEVQQISSASTETISDSITVDNKLSILPIADAASSNAKSEKPTEELSNKIAVTSAAGQTSQGSGSVASTLSIVATPSVPPTNSTAEKELNGAGSAKATQAEESSDVQSVADKRDTKPEEKNTALPKSDEQSGAGTQAAMRSVNVETVGKEKTTTPSLNDAMNNFNSGNYKISSAQFDEILKNQPNNIEALYYGGISDYINDNIKKGEKNFDKLLKGKTKYTEGSKWYKANILLKRGKKEEAKKLLDELAISGGSYKERAIKKKAEIEF